MAVSAGPNVTGPTLEYSTYCTITTLLYTAADDNI